MTQESWLQRSTRQRSNPLGGFLSTMVYGLPKKSQPQSPPVQPMVTPPQWLIDAIQNLIDTGYMNKKDADRYLQNYIQDQTMKAARPTASALASINTLSEAQSYINNYASDPQDAEARLRELNLDDNLKADIFDNYLNGYNQGANKQFNQQTSGMLEQAATNPGAFNINDWYSGQRNPAYGDLLQYVNDANARNNAGEKRSMQINEAVNAERSRAFGNPFDRSGEAQYQPKFNPMPDAGKVINEFNAGGYGSGSRLRSFIESQIPDIYAANVMDRQKWWQAMNEPGAKTFSQAQQDLQNNINLNKQIAESAPTTESVGNTFWGEGGPAALAKASYERQINELANLNPNDFGEPEPRPNLEDPLKAALRGRNWMTEYYRGVGTGLNRKTGGVRFA